MSDERVISDFERRISNLKEIRIGDFSKYNLRLTTKRWFVWEKVGLTNKERDEK